MINLRPAQLKALAGMGIRSILKTLNNGLRHIARQNLRAGEDENGNGQKKKDAQRDALGDEFENG